MSGVETGAAAPRAGRHDGSGEVDGRRRVRAARLGRSFVDLDDLIMTHAAMSIEEIWRERGEERFRELEREVVADVCASPVPLVIACGGGTVVDADNRRRLREAGVVVWLRAPTAVLAARRQRREPAAAGRRSGGCARPARRRASDAYTAAADAVVETEGHDVDAVADAVLAAFAEVVGVAS